MPRYRVVTQKVYLKPANERQPRICHIGEELEFDGPPGRNLQPLDEAAEQASRRAGGGFHRGSIATTFAGHNRGS